MKLRIEISALIIGLIGSGLSFALVTWWSAFPIDVREYFRGGNLGGQIIGIFALVGLVGIPMCQANGIHLRQAIIHLRNIDLI